MRLIYDIMPPKKMEQKTTKRNEEKFLRIVSLLLVFGVVFNWAGFSGIVGTVAYLNDSEESKANTFTAGALDFILGSPNDFLPSPLAPGESAHREINFLNTYNLPKYQVRAGEFTGELCDDLILEASLDGGVSVSRDLIGFVSGIVDFGEPDLWSFKLTLPADAPESVQGQTCEFKFIFDGSQIKNDLPFGQGFNDTEEINSSIAAESCEYFEIKSHGYWKNHSEVYADHLPQNLGEYAVDTSTKANAVLVECGGSDMSDRLRCQLLAMKFNIAHFGIGEYIPTGDTRTLQQIVDDADNILRNPEATREEMEQMKTLLDNLNNLGQVKICGIGGEQPMIVINKVYYDVDNEHGTEGDNEFIELYNPSRVPIDISGWIIEDNASQDTIPASTIIPGFGFAIITGNNSTFGYWDVPADVIKIILNDGKIGDGLDDDGDRVILKSPATVEKPDGIEVDAMSYGTDDSGFYPNPPCPDVVEGHMLGRYPNGLDTDTNNDWKDYGLPSIHVDYPNGGETWYVGRTYTLKWTATNPNGNNSDLLIDLYYSNDSGVSWGNITMRTENDGQYDWRVPLFIGDVGMGYYVPSARGRIKAVARNRNNFMVNDWDMSDTDFCPPIDYEQLTPEEAAYILGLGAVNSTEGTVIEEVVDTVENFVQDLLGETPTETTEPEATEPEVTEPEAVEPEITEPEQAVQPEEILPIEELIEVPVEEPLIETNSEESIILPEETILLEETILPEETINE